MRQAITSPMLAECRALVVAIVAGMPFMAGCMADIPLVSVGGAIGKGNPKLRGLLHVVREMRDENALRSRNVREAVYVAFVEPASVPVSSEGSFPSTDRAVAGRYYLVTSHETAKDALVAVVTQFLVIHRGAACETQTYSMQLVWRNGRWEEVPMIRMSYVSTPAFPDSGNPEEEPAGLR